MERLFTRIFTGVGPRTHDLLADQWAGLAAMLVALPSAIAFGVSIFGAASPDLAGAGALAGIVGAAALGITAPLVGRNSGFVTAPCAPAAAVMSGTAAELARAGHRPVAIVALLTIAALAAAALQFLYGLLRAGRVIKFIPYQVVSGYLSGVAVIIAAGQLPKILGVPNETDLLHALAAPRSWHLADIVVGAATMAAMILSPRLTKRVPGAIVGLAAGIAAYLVAGLFVPELLALDGNTHVIGRLERSTSFAGALTTRLGALGDVHATTALRMLSPALTLSALLSIDTLKTGVVLDALTKKRHDSNRELIAQGTANAVSALIGGLPGAGAMGASLVNVTSGSRSIASSVFAGVLALVTFVALGPLIAWVPTGALAGILLVVAWRMFDFGALRLLQRSETRLDFAVIAAVIGVAASIGLIEASVVGVCLAIVLFIRDQIQSNVILRKSDLRSVRSKRRRTKEENAILDERGVEAVVVQLQDDLFFGTTDQLFTELEYDLTHRRFILLDFRRVRSMDFTAGHLLQQMHERMHNQGGDLLFSGMPSRMPTRQDLLRYMYQLGIVGQGGGVDIFETRDSALEWMETKILESAGWTAPESKPPIALGETSLFRGLPEALLARLEPELLTLHVKAGEQIFQAGDPGDKIFIIRRGRVHISMSLVAGKRHHLATFARADFFGETSFLDGQPRSTEAFAAADTDLFVLTREVFERQIQTRAEVAAHFYPRLAAQLGQRIRSVSAELRVLEDR